jgi:hypothetical protein
MVVPSARSWGEELPHRPRRGRNARAPAPFRGQERARERSYTFCFFDPTADLQSAVEINHVCPSRRAQTRTNGKNFDNVK